MNQPLAIQPNQVTTNPPRDNPSSPADINPTTTTPGYDFSSPTPRIEIKLDEPETITAFYIPTNRVDLPTTVEEFTVTIIFPDGETFGPFPSETPSPSSPSETTTTTPAPGNVVGPSPGSPQVTLPANFNVPKDTVVIIDVTDTKNDLDATGVCTILQKEKLSKE